MGHTQGNFLTTQTLPRPVELLQSIFQIGLASCFISLCAQISIPLFFTPVPLTAQTFAVLLMGALLGKEKGALAVFFYLVQGLFGLPVLAGGHGGASYFFGVTGGYLFAFLIESYLIGMWLENRKDQGLLQISSYCFLATLIQLTLGALWLSAYVGISSAFLLGFAPFVIGDLIKSILAAGVIKKYGYSPLSR